MQLHSTIAGFAAALLAWIGGGVGRETPRPPVIGWALVLTPAQQRYFRGVR